MLTSIAPQRYRARFCPFRPSTASTFAAAPQSPANFEQEWSKLAAAAQAGRHVGDRIGRRAVAPVPPGDRRVHRKSSASKSKSRPATRPIPSIACSPSARPGSYTVDVALISSRENQQRLVPSESVVPFAPLLIHPEVVECRHWYGGKHWYGDKIPSSLSSITPPSRISTRSGSTPKNSRKRIFATVKKQTDIFDPRWKGKIARPRHGRSVRHSPDDRRLFRARSRARLGEELSHRRRRDVFGRPADSRNLARRRQVFRAVCLNRGRGAARAGEKRFAGESRSFCPSKSA